jgi:hypothetical protein
MKHKIVYLCFLLLLSISCKEQPSDLDEMVLPCYEARYQEAGYDIKTIIDDYETLLVKEGILNEASGKGYLEVMSKIHSDRDFRIEAPTFGEQDPFFKVDIQTKLAVFECEREKTEMAKEKDPKWDQLNQLLGNPEMTENPDRVYQAMEETFSEKDLNSYYFRLKMFQLFDMVNTKNWDNRTSLAPNPSE